MTRARRPAAGITVLAIAGLAVAWLAFVPWHLSWKAAQWLDDLPEEFPGQRSGNTHSLPGYRGPRSGRELSWEEWERMGRSTPGMDAGLVALLRRETDSYTRGQIAHGLGVVGGERSVRALIVLLEEGDTYDQFMAVLALGRLGVSAAVRPLIRATASADENVRVNAYIVLGRIGGPGVESYIRRGLADASQLVRDCCLEALRDLEQHPGATASAPPR